MTNWWIDWLPHRLTGRLTDWPIDWLSVWLNDKMTDYLTDWLIRWLSDSGSDFLTVWLTDCWTVHVWLTGWPTNWQDHLHVVRPTGGQTVKSNKRLTSLYMFFWHIGFQPSWYASFVHDSVHLYSLAVNDTISCGYDITNTSEVLLRMFNRRFQGKPISYHTHTLRSHDITPLYKLIKCTSEPKRVAANFHDYSS